MLRSMKVTGSWVLALALAAASGGCQKEAGAGDAVTVASEDAAPKPTEAPPTTAATTEAPDAAPSAPETAHEAPDAAAEAAALQDKIKALAVASECLRKQGVTPEQASQTMLALYRAHGIELDVYTREMGRLAGDPKFQEEVQAALASCPAAPVVAEVDAGAAPEADAGAAPEADTAAAPEPDTVAAPEPDTVAAPEPDTVAAPEPDTVEAPRPDVVAAPDTVTAPDAGTTPPPPASKLTGTWTGSLTGQGGGSLRMTVNGRNVTSAVATFGRIKITLKGSITDKGLVTLNGRKDNNFVRVKANVDKSQAAISGTWDGTIEKKKVGGKVRMTK